MRQSTLTAILGTILLGAAAGPAHAQYRDRDNGYGGGYPGGGRGDYVVGRVMRDVEAVGRSSYRGSSGIFGGGDRHARDAMNDLQNFDARWQRGQWDQRRLDKAIEHVSALANSRYLGNRERQLMWDDANLLRQFRASRGGGYGNGPYGAPPYRR
jgi:hypothetical protein